MFLSLCEAVLAFHTHDPPYAHRDIKVLYLFICNLHSHSFLITNLQAAFLYFVNTNPSWGVLSNDLHFLLVY